MKGINYTRVVLGGLAAGAVANVCDALVNGFLMAEDGVRMAQRLSLDQSLLNAGSTAVTWVVIDFIYGFALIWTYAAIRPRFGPGAGTALLAAAPIYISITAVMFGFQTIGIFTADMWFKSALYSLVTTSLASLAGASVYKED